MPDSQKSLFYVDYPGTDSDVIYTYDVNGNRLTMQNEWTDFEWTYDFNNKMCTQKNNVLNKTISYTYDANGNRATMTDGENGVTNYTYDDIDRLTRIQNPDYENTDYTYGDAGEKLLQTNANGTRTEYFYDDLYRLVLMANKKSNGDTISSFAYSYDKAGNRMSKIYENGDTEIYSYDNLYQLTKVETKDKTTEYDYDKVGNRMQMKIFATEDTEVTEYFYNSDNQLLSYNVNGIDTVSFIYDANGNQIFKITASDTVKYDYDYDNNLLCVSAANDTIIISYIYSPDGKRLKKYLNGIGTKYFYDSDDVLIEYDTNTTVQVRYTNNLGIDDIISSKRNSITEWYHKDALGSIVNLTDNSQLSTVNYRYDEFGSIESQSNSHQNEYTYTGRQIDREAGLYYYRSRYYNSAVGRFINKDELINFDQKPLNFNFYIYVINNPLILIDPSGQWGRFKFSSKKKESSSADCGYVEPRMEDVDFKCKCKTKKKCTKCKIKWTFKISAHIYIAPASSIIWSKNTHWQDPVLESEWHTSMEYSKRKRACLKHEQLHVDDDKAWYDSTKASLQSMESTIYSSDADCNSAGTTEKTNITTSFNIAITQSINLRH